MSTCSRERRSHSSYYGEKDSMILGIIPVRGGSKGIPRKNIKEICGKPLITWTIEAAKASQLLDRYVVSTEDSEIANVAESWGAEVLNRPNKLATDDASTLSVLQHALSIIPADIVVLLQATSPIRDVTLIDRAIRRFKESAATSLATGFICKFKEYGSNELRRQDIEGFFYDDGNVYVIQSDIIQVGDRYGKRIERMIIDREQNVEIDDDYDFWLAEKILKKRAQSKKSFSVCR